MHDRIYERRGTRNGSSQSLSFHITTSNETAIYNPNTETSTILRPIRLLPSPLRQEELQISNECKVCFVQHIDILFLPCAHLVMCRYCAEDIVPTAVDGKHTGKCPLCRSPVTQKVNFF